MLPNRATHHIFQRNIQEQIFKHTGACYISMLHQGACYISGFRKTNSVSNIYKSIPRLSYKLFLKVEALFNIWFQFYEFLVLLPQPVILWFHPPMVSNTDSCLSVCLFAIFFRNYSQGLSDFLNDASYQNFQKMNEPDFQQNFHLFIFGKTGHQNGPKTVQKESFYYFLTKLAIGFY